METTLGSLLAKRARLNPEKPAIVFQGCVLSYAELNARAVQWARTLMGLNVNPGDRVGVFLSNCNEFVEVFFGLAKIGAIGVLINWRLTPTELEVICQDAGTDTFVFGQEYTQAVDSLRARTKLRELICVGNPAPDWSRSDAYLDIRNSEAPLPKVNGADPSVIIYTSGTTGKPKGAALSHENLFWWGATLIPSVDLRQDDRGLVIAPLFHSVGILATVTHLMRGCTTIIARSSPFDPEKVLETIRSEKVNNFIAVPVMLRLLSQVQRYEEYFGSVRWLLSVGAPIASTLIEEYYRRGIRVLQIYGSTETGPVAAIGDPTKVISKIGSVGPPLLLSNLRVVDDDGRELPPGMVGEVAVNGPNVMLGYWKNPEATAEAIRDGWFHTGDIAMMDEDGYLFIVDRKSDMINSSGEHIYPAEVEHVLSNHPKVEDVAVVGQPDEEWGEAACAVIKTKGGAALSLREISDFCEGKLARFKIPRRLIIVETPLPHGPSGKLLKAAIREQLKSG